MSRICRVHHPSDGGLDGGFIRRSSLQFSTSSSSTTTFLPVSKSNLRLCFGPIQTVSTPSPAFRISANGIEIDSAPLIELVSAHFHFHFPLIEMTPVQIIANTFTLQTCLRTVKKRSPAASPVQRTPRTMNLTRLHQVRVLLEAQKLRSRRATPPPPTSLSLAQAHPSPTSTGTQAPHHPLPLI